MTVRSILTWRDVLRVIAGLLMLVLGLLGLVFPVLQGLLFLLIAAFLLAPYSPPIQRFLDCVRRRYPRTFARARAWRAKLGRRMRKRRGY